MIRMITYTYIPMQKAGIIKIRGLKSKAMRNMKLLMLMAATGIMNAQIQVNNGLTFGITGSNAMIDGSAGFSTQSGAGPYTGKGIVIPSVDLVNFQFVLTPAGGTTFPTWFDGMIVYNNATGTTLTSGNRSSTAVSVTPGFYYFYNPNGAVNANVTGGQWKPIGGNSINVPAGSATTGTLIAINGQMTVAQQITVQLTADFSTPAATIPLLIGNLNREILDNENRYSGSATGNSFKVSASGTYEISINAQLSTDNGSYPVIGLWDDTTGKWIARVNDTFSAPSGGLQTYTLISSADLPASDTYSFRMANNTSGITLMSQSSGTTGSGPVSQFSVRRMR